MKKVLFALLALGPVWMSPAVYAAPGVGEAGPEFSLADVNGQTRTLSEFKGKYVVLEWMNPDCPFVKKHYDSGNMQALQKEYTAKNVAWLTINSSADGKQGHYAAADWQKMVADKGIASTAVLLDASGVTGQAYGAKTTPHVFVLNPEGQVIYKGAIDDKSSTDAADIAGAKNYVRAALDEAMAGQPVTTASTESYGCGVKY